MMKLDIEQYNRFKAPIRDINMVAFIKPTEEIPFMKWFHNQQMMYPRLKNIFIVEHKNFTGIYNYSSESLMWCIKKV